MMSLALVRAAATARPSAWHAASALCPSAAGFASAASPDEVRTAYGYCVEQVRQYDYDNYIWMTQLPKESRPALFMLRAFNIDTSMIAESVRSKEPALVQMRYQWWRDGVSQAFKGNAPRHPVLIALQDVLSRLKDTNTAQSNNSSAPSVSSATSRDGSSEASTPAAGSRSAAATKGAGALKQYHFKRMIDTRENDALDPQPPLDVSGLEQYAEGTASQLLYLQLGAVGAGSRESDHVASHLGKAVGITTLLQGTPFHAAHRRSYLPIDLCVQHHVSQEGVYSGQCSEGLRDVVLAVASVAKGHLDEARALRKHLPSGAASVLLSAVACERYLHALERANFDVFSPTLQPGQGQAAHIWHVLQTKYRMLTGTF